jgi:chromosome segregation ATPase
VPTNFFFSAFWPTLIAIYNLDDTESKTCSTPSQAAENRLRQLSHILAEREVIFLSLEVALENVTRRSDSLRREAVAREQHIHSLETKTSEMDSVKAALKETQTLATHAFADRDAALAIAERHKESALQFETRVNSLALEKEEALNAANEMKRAASNSSSESEQLFKMIANLRDCLDAIHAEGTCVSTKIELLSNDIARPVVGKLSLPQALEELKSTHGKVISILNEFAHKNSNLSVEVQMMVAGIFETICDLESVQFELDAIKEIDATWPVQTEEKVKHASHSIAFETPDQWVGLQTVSIVSNSLSQTSEEDNPTTSGFKGTSSFRRRFEDAVEDSSPSTDNLHVLRQLCSNITSKVQMLAVELEYRSDEMSERSKRSTGRDIEACSEMNRMATLVDVLMAQAKRDSDAIIGLQKSNTDLIQQRDDICFRLSVVSEQAKANIEAIDALKSTNNSQEASIDYLRTALEAAKVETMKVRYQIEEMSIAWSLLEEKYSDRFPGFAAQLSDVSLARSDGIRANGSRDCYRNSTDCTPNLTRPIVLAEYICLERAHLLEHVHDMRLKLDAK